tara:strand:+ start:350 stop:772 length:423 start_codon:yes stop_codon:yes gene_type:complete
MLKLLIFLLMVTFNFSSSSFKNWRWAEDTMEMTFDKETHLAGSFGLYYLFRHKEYTEFESVLYSTSLGLTKEIIDGLLPWEEYGKWGGDGFSKNDLTYNLIGVGLAYGLDKVWKPQENKGDFTIGYNISGTSINYRIYFR